MPPTFRMHRSLLVVATLAIGVVLTAIQSTTLERLKAALIADPSSGTYRPGLADKAWSVLPALHPIDWALLAFFFATVLALLVVEVRSGRVRAELAAILASERHTLVLTGVLAMSACRFYLAPGEFALGDSPAHVARIWTTGESLSGWQWPSWSFFTYAGYPFLQFYGAAFFLLAGVPVALSADLLWTTKSALFLLHAGSAFPVYAWARTTGLERPGALVAAMVYVLSFLHTHTVVWTGALPVALVFALFPIVLWALEHALAVGSRRWLVIMSLSVAALVGTHHGYAAFALELIFVYMIARFVLARAARPALRRVVPALLALLGGTLLGGGPLLRVFLEGSWVHLPATGLPLSLPAIPDRRFLADILVWRNTWTGWTTAYIGISVMVLAVAGAFFAFRRVDPARDRLVRRSAAVVALFTLLCAAGSGRLVNLALPWLALLAGGTTRPGIRALSPRACLILLAILVADLGPTTVQSPYRTDRAWLSEGLRRVARAVGPHRTLVGYESGAGTHFFHWGAYGDTGLILPTGHYPQGAPESLASINALVDAMNTPGYGDSARADLLYLWDVGALVTHGRDRFTTPHGGGDGAPFTPVSPASPLLFSRQMAVANDDSLQSLQRTKLDFGHTASDEERRRYLARLRPWVDAMQIDRGRASARVIFVAGPAGVAASPAVDAGHGGVEVTRYDVDLRKATISCRTREPGFLRIAFSWYPTLVVRVDGEPVTPWRSVLGAIVIPSEPGEHTIELVPASHWRTRSPLIALAGVLIVLAATVIAARSSA